MSPHQISKNTPYAIFVLVLAWLLADVPLWAESAQYTAQRRPRVTVDKFEDTNAHAQQAGYALSVEAMLVTFLRQHSQLVVVERQKLGPVLEEWKLRQDGFTNDEPNDIELLEKIDGIIQGSVTLLNQTDVGRHSEGSTEDLRSGQRVEIDIKLLSRVDGRIIAAAQRSGPDSCLRSIVERLGAALEYEFLRPYFGKVQFTLSDPENVDIFLTPILGNNALDEEKPPLERGTTTYIGDHQDTIVPWTTDPSTYTVENILSGWYTIRMARPGYEGIGTDNARWQARTIYGSMQIYDLEQNRPWRRGSSGDGRFVIRIDAQGTKVIDGDAMQLSFRKQGGSLTTLSKRAFLDTEFGKTDTRRVMLFGGNDIDLNRNSAPFVDPNEERPCDVTTQPYPTRDYGETYVALGQTFDFDAFRGGKIRIENYQGETLPTGEYTMVVWEPYYEPNRSTVTVQDQDHHTIIRRPLRRSNNSVRVTTMGRNDDYHIQFRGIRTGNVLSSSLDFEEHVFEDLPVDQYVVTVDIPGLTGWEQRVDLLPPKPSPPSSLEDLEPSDPPSEESAISSDKVPSMRAKTRMCVAGRMSALASEANLQAEDVYQDKTVGRILDVLLRREQHETERPGWLDSFLPRVSLTVKKRGPSEPVPSPPPTPPPQEAEAAEAPPPPPPKRRWTPEQLRNLLIERLADVDLLILDDQDMAKLREQPEVEAIVSNYLVGGGSLFAFVSNGGDYESIVGAPLELEVKGKPTPRFELSKGDTGKLDFTFHKEKVKVRNKRILPKLRGFRKSKEDWRVLAYTKGSRDPRILERGGRGESGYIVVWCDHLPAFRGKQERTVKEIEESRTSVEAHVLRKAKLQMHSRFESPEAVVQYGSSP